MNGNLVGGKFNLSTRKSAQGVWNVNEIAARTARDIWPTLQDSLLSKVWFLVHGNTVLDTGLPNMAVKSASLSSLARAVFWGPGTSVAATSLMTIAPTPFAFGGTSFMAGNQSTNGLIVDNHSTNIAIGTSNFTLECWFYVKSPISSNISLLDFRQGGSNGNWPLISIVHGTPDQMRYLVNGTAQITAGTVTLDTPHHVAYERTGGNLGTLYLDGASLGTWADTTTYANQQYFPISASTFSGVVGLPINSFIDEIRLTVGATRYNGAFTAPTARFPDY